MGQSPPPRQALAVFSMNGVKGGVRFTELRGGVLVAVRLQGVPPGDHGLHVHECGDIGGDACKRAGAHYNPRGATHGGAHQGARHPGDLGNVEADASGAVRVDVKIPHVCLRDLVGRSVVIHANRDDLGGGVGGARAESLKTGNSGARLACAVVGWANC